MDMLATNPTFSWSSELRDSHSLRAWVIFPMRRAALLDMLGVMFGQYTSEGVGREEMENIVKSKSHVVRDYIMPNFEASKAEVCNSPLCSTPSEQRDGPAFEMPASMVVGRTRLI